MRKAVLVAVVMAAAACGQPMAEGDAGALAGSWSMAETWRAGVPDGQTAVIALSSAHVVDPAPQGTATFTLGTAVLGSFTCHVNIIAERDGALDLRGPCEHTGFDSGQSFTGTLSAASGHVRFVGTLTNGSSMNAINVITL